MSNPLFAPLEYLKGVGPARADRLRRLGLFRPVDLLFFFPRDYQDMTLFRAVSDLTEGELQTVAGTVIDFSMRQTRRGPLTTLVVEDDRRDTLEAIWFHQPWHYAQFALGRRVLLTGKPTLKNEAWQMSHPKLFWDFDASSNDNANEPPEENVQASRERPPFLPIYPLTEGLQQHHLQRIVRPLLETLPDCLDEVFPKDFLDRHRLLPIAEAVRKIHFPADLNEAAEARRRFCYQELFLLQLALGVRRKQHEINLKADALPVSPKIEGRIRRLIPFDLTEAQKRVIGEISADMGRSVPMNRLLQGDVGSGKTIVAFYAMLIAAANHRQSAIMAPTEVLARQHERVLSRLLENSRVRLVSIFGGQKPKERQETLAAIADGSADIVVGTQAMICNDVEFDRLGLVVIDEQHRFGVEQRARLKTGTPFDPHYLVMTATPIPRSVTMTLFGDLDISTLDGLPPGRQQTHTYAVSDEKRAAWWDFVRRKIAQGRQGYVVVPRVETDESEELRSVQETHDALAAGELTGVRLGILHGRMTSEEKERVMLDFRSGAIQILVCTSVIEVGVDVPNATLMTIENAGRFGLAQLHQLRGRIGRGKHAGFCAVFQNDKENDETENESASISKPNAGKSTAKNRKRKKSPTDDGKKTVRPANTARSRLEVFAHSNDGFYLAEKDFELRGPGELFGTRQHGLGSFRIADPLRDREILEEARLDARETLNADPGLAAPEHQRLRRQMLTRYGTVLELGDVG